jgi:hypothetical protein
MMEQCSECKPIDWDVLEAQFNSAQPAVRLALIGNHYSLTMVVVVDTVAFRVPLLRSACIFIV